MKQLQTHDTILFLDIETVPETTDFTQLDKEAQDLYAAKTAYKRKAANLSAEDYYSHAGIWAEFGDFKHYTSLKLLAHFFDIPSPKDDMEGSDVAGVYYEEKDLTRIVRYCEKDVITLCPSLS